MAKNNIKQCSATLIIRETQVKTLRYYLIAVRMDLSKNQKTSVGEEVEKQKPLYTASRNAKMVHLPWKMVQRFLKTWKMEVPCDLQSHFSVSVQKNGDEDFDEASALARSLQHYLQEPRCGNHLTDHQGSDGVRKCGIHIHWNSIQTFFFLRKFCKMQQYR